MFTLHALLLVAATSGCYGIPTKDEILSAVDRARLQNNRQKRDVAVSDGLRISSCPHLTRHAHGQRYSRDIHNTNDNTANVLIAAMKSLIEDGHSSEDLQHEDVRRALQEHATNCPTTQLTCTSPTINKYRTADGSCNNEDHPGWGQAGLSQARLAPAAYEDGMSAPRSKSVLGGDLPNPRTISNTVHAAPEIEKPATTLKSKKNTLHIMQMGQFLAHDIIHTPVQTIVPNCCSEEGRADVDNCLPIIVPGNDLRFEEGYCMNFPRSAPMVCPITSTKREQVNGITSFIDASNVYGSSEEEANALRVQNAEGGYTAFLRTEEGDRLPDNKDQTVCKSNATAGIACSLAGDVRVNEQPGLTTYHTLFVREHNRIVKALANYTVDYENIYQVTRKVVGAVMQRITYKEFLPEILGQGAMDKFKLSLENSIAYNKSMNPTVLNEFGIGNRMGHSWIPSHMNLYQKDFKPYKEFKLETTYFDPYLTYITRDSAVRGRGSVDGMEGMAYYMSSVFSPKVDRIVNDAARNELFVDDDGNAFDLVARNIQRERDHGVQPYNTYRKICGQGELSMEWNDATLGALQNTHKKKVVELLQSVYASPLDIDLFTGALTEKPEKDGEVGPTLACLLGEQFMRLKYGDRFWFQNTEGVENSFTQEQQAEIQKASMARLLCDNMGFYMVHRNAFIKKNRVLCNRIPKMDLSKFIPADDVNAPADDVNANHSGSQSDGDGKESQGTSQSDSATGRGNPQATGGKGNGNGRNRRPVLFN